MNRLLLSTAALLLTGCALDGARPVTEGWRYSEAIVTTHDDLATAGLGVAGLQGAPPQSTDPLQATTEELRRLAIYNNYRALVDVSDGGGFARLFGPDHDAAPVPGAEYVVLGQHEDGLSQVLVLQVPDSFRPEAACLIAAPSSGSRGPYGAIGTSGDWGLRRGCAVIYSDKGGGPWISGFDDERVYDIQGRWGPPDSLQTVEPFSARSWPNNRSDVAFKHAHSGHNPEGRWGEMVLASIRHALALLDTHHRPGDRRAYDGDNIHVIAASVSNGGAAVLQAAEADEQGLIDAIVAAAPNIHVAMPERLTLREGDRRSQLTGRPLYDYASRAALLEPCATLADRMAGAPLAAGQMSLIGLLSNRCTALANSGLVSGEATAELAEAAWQALLEYGAHPESADATVFNTMINLWMIMDAMYANAYTRAAPGERPCGVGFRAFDSHNRPATVQPGAAALMFAIGSGVPPVAGIDLAVADAQGRDMKIAQAPSQATGKPAYAFDQARCFRGLYQSDSAVAERLKRGVHETSVSGNLRGKPAIVIHGRSDALIWVNHSSRSYFAANQAVEGATSRLRYLEVTNVQHFDSALAIPGFDSRFVPLQFYFEQALDRMLAHLTEARPLPPSQVIHTRPRERRPQGVEPLDVSHLPLIAEQPGTESIQWLHNTLIIPH